MNYQDRTIQQSLRWVNGNPQHNKVDDECCADFSCCIPALFIEKMEDRQKIHKNLLKRLNRGNK